MEDALHVNNLIVISDLHCGCRAGLCPDQAIPLDEGGTYMPSAPQKKMWKIWKKFWKEWVPQACRGEPYAVLVNGDALDGVHHGAKTQISQNHADQNKVAMLILEPIADECEGRFFMNRGTEAHAGKSAEMEEMLARMLGAVKDESDHHSRFEIFLRMGSGLIHALHHIGTTGASHYESSAVMKELAESFTESGRWGDSPPDMVVRSHRHRNIEVRIPTKSGYGISLVTAGWQLKTPFTYRVAGGRLTTPQIGGTLIRQGKTDFFTQHRVWRLERPKVVKI